LAVPGASRLEVVEVPEVATVLYPSNWPYAKFLVGTVKSEDVEFDAAGVYPAVRTHELFAVVVIAAVVKLFVVDELLKAAAPRGLDDVPDSIIPPYVARTTEPGDPPNTSDTEYTLNVKEPAGLDELTFPIINEQVM